jgi:Flp pilus assembly protein TadG
MSTVFFLLSFLALVALILGLIKPSLVMRWGDMEKRTRKRAAITYFFAFIILFIAFTVSLPKDNSVQNTASTKTPATVQEANTTPAPAPTTPSQATKVQPYQQLTKDQQLDVKILSADLGVITNDAQNHDLANFAVDLKGQEQDVASADKDITGRPLGSKDSFQNVFTTPANVSPSDYQISPNQLFRTLVYSMQSVDSDIANPSTGSGSYINDLGTDVENVRDDAADAQQVFVVLGYPS